MHDDCCLNALIAPPVLKSIICCSGIQAKWRPLSFTTPSMAAVALFPISHHRPPGDKGDGWFRLLSLSSTATALQTPSTSPIPTFKLFLQLVSTVRRGSFLLLYTPYVLGNKIKKKKIYLCTSSQIAGKKRATSPTRCLFYFCGAGRKE